LLLFEEMSNAQVELSVITLSTAVGSSVWGKSRYYAPVIIARLMDVVFDELRTFGGAVVQV